MCFLLIDICKKNNISIKIPITILKLVTQKETYVSYSRNKGLYII